MLVGDRAGARDGAGGRVYAQPRGAGGRCGRRGGVAVLAGLSAPWVFAATQVDGAETEMLVAVPLAATVAAAALFASASHGSNAVRRCRDEMEVWERPGGRAGAGAESGLDAYSSEKIRGDYARGRELREARERTTGAEPESEPAPEPESEPGSE